MCFVSAQRDKFSLRSEASTGLRQVVCKPSVQAEESYVGKGIQAFSPSFTNPFFILFFLGKMPDMEQREHEPSARLRFCELHISVRFGLKFIVAVITRNGKNCKKAIY